MSPTATSSSSQISTAELTTRVAEAAAKFPADGLVAGPADSQDELNELLPSEDALVLVATVADAPDQRLVAVVNPALLTAIGLSDASGLGDALDSVLSALAGGATVGEAKVGIGPIGLADLAPAGPGARLVAAGLFLGSDHVATLGVGLAGANESGANEAGADDSGADEVRADESTPAPVAPASMDLPEVPSPRPAANQAIAAGANGARSLDLLRNVEMNVTAELGRTKMTVADLLSLTPGSVVELDRSAGTPIDVMVNGTLIAKGEVVVIDEEFGVRISEIVDRVDGA